MTRGIARLWRSESKSLGSYKVARDGVDPLQLIRLVCKTGVPKSA